MAKNNERKNNVALTCTCALHEKCKNYLINSRCTHYCWDEDLRKESTVNIIIGDEFQNVKGTLDSEILILLEHIDHDEDLEQNEYECYSKTSKSVAGSALSQSRPKKK